VPPDLRQEGLSYFRNRCYFRDVLVRISEPGSSARIRDLLPANWKKSADAAQRQADARLAIANVVKGLVYA